MQMLSHPSPIRRSVGAPLPRQRKPASDCRRNAPGESPGASFSFGIQYDGAEDEPMVTLGIEHPLWFMTIIDDDEDDVFFDSH